MFLEDNLKDGFMNYKKVYELAEENGYTFIHPFDDLAVATGQGTIAMEIVQ